jgi:hypothetical protein
MKSFLFRAAFEPGDKPGILGQEFFAHLPRLPGPGQDHQRRLRRLPWLGARGQGARAIGFPRPRARRAVESLAAILVGWVPKGLANAKSPPLGRPAPGKLASAPIAAV